MDYSFIGGLVNIIGFRKLLLIDKAAEAVLQ